ncbi:PKD domain-containing protein [Sphingobacteriales bacterium UPWRP_1]|nr:hypothetical protein B6N25_04520 [Sphingobacteriales bacterium TSM_CSS]PSJ77735.1 PKD domain-containing protein [Sphingobacteriales bacterium UPWRP_1]
MKKLFILLALVLTFAFSKAQQLCEVSVYANVYCFSAEFYPYAYNPTDTFFYYQLPIASVQWNFGDSDSLFTYTNPDDGSLYYAAHSYTAEGNYNVCCTIVTTDGCIDTNCQMITIGGICNLQPQTYAYADYTNPNTFYFSTYITQCNTNEVNYSWDFGDGTPPVTDLYPTHTYTADGLYQACCTISYPDGSCLQTACVYALVDSNGPDNCELTINPYNYFNSNEFYFDAFITCDYFYTDSIATAYYNWYYNWDFGNGQTASGNYPYVIYSEVGYYTVCVTATNDFGTVLSNCTTVSVTQLPVDCALSFTAEPDVPDGLAFTFTPAVNPECVADTSAYLWWDFGDGTAFSAAGTTIQQHTYATSGYYYVCLNVTGVNTTNSFYCQAVIAGDADCMPSFSYNQGTDYNTFIFTPQLTNCSDTLGAWTYTWDFGDGTTLTNTTGSPQPHTYATSGYYIICLTAYNPNGVAMPAYCSSVYVYDSSMTCNVSFYPYTYNGYTYDFSVWFENGLCGWYPLDTYSFAWDFGDGTTLTTPDMYVQHTYSQFGITNVCLTAVSTTSADTSSYCTTIDVTDCYIPLYVYGYPMPTPGAYQFNAGVYMPLSDATYAWDFGDGTTANSETPLHTFTANGTYNVCCTVTMDTCATTMCTTVQADIDGPNSCEVVFYPSDFGDGTFAFYPYITATDPADWVYTYYPEQWTYLWDFGNGQTSTEPYPFVFFDTVGVYNVCLTASYGSITTLSYCQEITVNTSQYSCSVYYYANTYDGATYTFYPSIGGTCIYTNPTGWPNPDENWTYLWDFGNGQTSTEVTPTITFEPNMFYNVCLTATNTEQDFTDTFCNPVFTYVLAPGADTSSICNLTFSTITYDAFTFILYPSFNAACTDTDFWIYLWNFGNGQTSTDMNPVVTFTDLLNYEVCLTATSLTGQIYTSCNTLIAGGGVIGGEVVSGGGGFNEGRVAGEAMAGVTVLLMNEMHQIIATAITDANGNYQFNSLPVGTYYVSVQMPGMLAEEANIALSQDNMMNMEVDFVAMSSMVMVNDNTATSTPQQPDAVSAVLYPNPTQGNTVLQLNATAAGNIQIAVYNVTGQLVYQTQQQQINGNNTIELPLERLPRGIYAVTVTSQTQVLYTGKVVKL